MTTFWVNCAENVVYECHRTTAPMEGRYNAQVNRRTKVFETAPMRVL